MHKIEFVDDDALPEGHDFMLVTCAAGAVLFYRRSAITPATLEDSWAAYRALCEQQTPPPSSVTPESTRFTIVDSRTA